MRIPHILFVPVFLPMVALAQATTTDSALTIRSSDAMVVRGALRAFDPAAKPPALEAGACAVLSLDDGGKVNVRTEQGDVFLSLDCRPGQLMEIFGAQVAQYKQMGQMMAGMGGAQMGLDFEDAGNIVTALFAFPAQVDRLTLTVPKNPEPTRELDLDLVVTPVADTWFGGFVDSLRANPKGAPVLADDGAMMTMSCNIDMPSAWKSLRPLFAPFAGIGQQSKEDKANAARYMDATMSALEGTVCAVFDPSNGGARAVAGLVSGHKLAEITKEEGYKKMQIAAAQIGDMAEATYDTAAIEHRGVSVARLVATYDSPEMNPFANEDGEVTSFSAVSGDTLISAMFGSGEAEIKALIDDVADSKLKRKSLPGDALGVFTLRMEPLMGFVSEMSQGQVPAAGDDMPAVVTANLKKAGKSLAIKVHAK